MSAMRGKRSGGHDGRKTYRIRCEWCWEIFHSEQIHAMTCGNAHRLRVSRWRRAYLDLTGELPKQNPRGNPSRMTALSAAIADGAPVLDK